MAKLLLSLYAPSGDLSQNYLPRERQPSLQFAALELM
jgi:hypothetical protein